MSRELLSTKEIVPRSLFCGLSTVMRTLFPGRDVAVDVFTITGVGSGY